jgi:caa(3)-type oxidase subunit IV
MTDTHTADTAEHEHGPNVRAYMIVFGALAVFTAISFIIKDVFEEHMGLDATSGMFIILAVAVVKACLVGAIFMHLKWDWGRLYFMIIPAFILAVMMMIVLMPDIVMAWKKTDLSPAASAGTMKK